LKRYLQFDQQSLDAVQILNRIGRAYLAMGQNRAAMQVYRTSAESWQAAAMLGAMLTAERVNDFLNAHRYGARLVRRYPTTADALAIHYYRLGWLPVQRYYEKRLRKHLLKNTTPQAASYEEVVMLGNSHMREEDWDKAMRIWSLAARKYPNKPELFFLYAVAAYAVGNRQFGDESVRVVSEVLPPENDYYHLARYWLGNASEEEVLTRLPWDDGATDVLFFLSRKALNKGDVQKANKYLEQIVKRVESWKFGFDYAVHELGK
jgi:tetratricopeptide (TPR) repeat protein